MSTSEPVGAEPSEGGVGPARRRLRWIGVVALCGVVGGLALWSERRTIATSVIDRKLADAHVRARYRIEDLGLGRQRLVAVVIGDPARPDLVADWIELRTRLALDGPEVTSVRAGGLRVRAMLRDGRLSLGEIDRLLPASAGSRFRLPAIDLSVSGARFRLDSPAGVAELTLSGQGRLDDGFGGRVTARSARLLAGGCTVPDAALAAKVRVDRGAITLTGPLGAERIACSGATVLRPAAEANVTLAPGLASWRGEAVVRTARATASDFTTRAVRGRVTFAGTARSTGGQLALAGGANRFAGVGSRGLAVSGRYRIGADRTFVGSIRASGLAAPENVLAVLRRQRQVVAGTPIAPLLARGAEALIRASRDVDAAVDLRVADAAVSITRVEARSRSGVQMKLVADAPIPLGTGAAAISGTARIEGGGLPTAAVRFARRVPDAALQGSAAMAPYEADGARLALGPVRFAWERTGGRLATAATLSGPIAGGRIEGLRLPVIVAWNGRSVSVDPGCTTVAFDRLTVATLRLTAAHVPLCASGPALIRVHDGRIAGGARIPSLRLAGALGGSPLRLAAQDVHVDATELGVTATDVAALLGEGDRATRLDLARLTATVGEGEPRGRFDGAGGQIGKVPLLLSDGAGAWIFANGALSLEASATVADAGNPARFRPLHADALRLRLAEGTIDASAALVAPDRKTRVADVTIAHDLRRGTGDATIAIPELAFTQSFQPDALTPLTFGVIADVRGSVSGAARIGWSPADVSSTGVFRSDGIDLAAAFGPVQGLAGTIRFTDLLALESAPDQLATVASINPGVPVEDGRIVYQLLPDARVAIARGHWPFAGGSLDLRPTTFAFGATGERRLTFVLAGVDAGRFLQQFDFDNLSATGTFDGTLPMIFDASGGRIEEGELRARLGGGNLAYLGELTKEDLGTWGNVAFQALRSIDYRNLAITMNGPLAGEMITDVRFAGISQGKGARSNFLIRRLQKLPLVFNIRIRAPFRGLIDSAQSFYDPARLVSRNLPALIEQQNSSSAPLAEVQPGASE